MCDGQEEWLESTVLICCWKCERACEMEKERGQQRKRETEEEKGKEAEKSIMCIKAIFELINNSRSVKKHPTQIQILGTVWDAS